MSKLKTHLESGSKTACGRELGDVPFTDDVELVDCVNCQHSRVYAGLKWPEEIKLQNEIEEHPITKEDMDSEVKPEGDFYVGTATHPPIVSAAITGSFINGDGNTNVGISVLGEAKETCELCNSMHLPPSYDCSTTSIMSTLNEIVLKMNSLTPSEKELEDAFQKGYTKGNNDHSRWVQKQLGLDE